jgi:methyltransferase (TIGR00027 family)
MLAPSTRLLARSIARLWPTQPRVARQLLRFLSFGLSEHVALRTVAIDQYVTQAVRDGITQVVVLGAGFDARAFRLAELETVKVFEVDHGATQAHKRRVLADTQLLSTAARPVFVPVDFARDSLEHALLSQQFAPQHRTLWIMEGVSMYLSRQALQATLATVAKLSAAQSCFVFTYVSPEAVSQWSQSRAGVDFVSRAIGERLQGLLTRAEAHELLHSSGWQLAQDEDTRELAARLAHAVPPSSVWIRERVAWAHR